LLPVISHRQRHGEPFLCADADWNCSIELETHSLVTGKLPTLAGERCNENKKLAGSIASPANEIVACRYKSGSATA
jgi:hypothetical protein